MVQTGVGRPARDPLTLGSAHRVQASLPYSLLVFVPVAALILLGLRRTGYGRLLYAIGDNPIAARLSGARSWQVLIVLYVDLGAARRRSPGSCYSGLHQRRQRDARRLVVLPSVAAAVIGGTSIMGGRGGYGGTIVGALILTVAHRRCSRRSGSRRPSARSCSGRSSSLVAAAYTRVTAET